LVDELWYEEKVLCVGCDADALGAASGRTGEAPRVGDRSG
jgi:hypothetical protein